MNSFGIGGTRRIRINLKHNTITLELNEQHGGFHGYIDLSHQKYLLQDFQSSPKNSHI
jgi:hypothetical protein